MTAHGQCKGRKVSAWGCGNTRSHHLGMGLHEMIEKAAMATV